VISARWPDHEVVDQRRIERLGEARVGQRDGKALRLQLPHGLPRLGQMCAEGQDRHVMAFLQHATLADLQHVAGLRHLDAHTLPARIAQRDGAASWAAAVAIMCTSSASSAQAMTVMFGSAAR
jgi:hypothetical protein